MRLLTVVLCLISGFSGYAHAATAGEVVVVANTKFPASALSVEDVRDIFLGKTREVPGVGSIRPVDLSPSLSLRDDFIKSVLDKTAKELNAYWSIRIFTGHGVPPQSVDSEREVKDWLAAHPDGIGYISPKNVDSTVKVLLRVKD